MLFSTQKKRNIARKLYDTTLYYTTFYFKLEVLFLFCIIPMVHQNSPTVKVWQEKIENNLRRANTEPPVDFRRTNIKPSVDFRKDNTEPSVHFKRANVETF